MGQTKKVEFQAEVKQLMDIVIHSLYSQKEIFLRELISNASDALDKRRFLGITDEAVREEDLFIKLIPNEKERTLTIKDNGIGMTEEEVMDNIGTIAKSGTKAFLANMKENADKPELIGQFGVGFYSSFIVADKVSLKTKKAGTDNAILWESSGDGSYSLTDTDKEEAGTEITLHLREADGEDEHNMDDYVKEYQLRSLVKKYSDFVTYPIKMDVKEEVKSEDDKEDDKEKKDEEKAYITKEETLNSMKALWTRPKSEIKEEEYNEFYKQISHDFTDPMDTIHFSAEGTIEYQSLLYIPSKRPFDLMYRDGKRGLSLYVKQVFIMADCEKIMPEYLRFVKGLVDSADLSLNVSRELLQEDRQITVIKKRLTKKVLDTLSSLKKNDKEKYLKFWAEFGEVLKEGLAMDQANAEELKDLMFFHSSAAAELTSLEDYVTRMPEDQKEIYYITGDSVSAVENSPLLEAFKEKGYEVLYLVDNVDEFMLQGLQNYKEKNLKSVNKGDVDLKSDDEKKADEAKEKENKDKYSSMLESMQKILDEDIKEVRLSNRLKSSAVCLVSDENGMTPQMEQMFASMGQEMPKNKRILEVNPEHAVIELLGGIFSANKEDVRIKDFSTLLHNQALLAEGLPIANPVEFAQKISELMVTANK
ncbi:MAG: molecular chaperone HtpG [Planctomycetes bacterium]|nr:molecular chaperone HtpG [Planctomycetota bacterium]